MHDGAPAPATARTTTVNRREQSHIAASAADAPAAVAEQATAAAPEEAPAIAQPPTPDGRARAAAVTRIIGTMVDVVGTSAEDRGRSCSRHTCCGHQIVKGSVVKVVHERMAWRDQGRVEDVLAVYAVAGNGTTTCRDNNVVKRQKFWRNKGCCVARVLGVAMTNGVGINF